MQIEPVSGNPYYSRNIQDKNSESIESKGNKIKDKLELSEEAKNIGKTQAENTNMDKIKERINNKFYDSPGVINNVADKILNDIKGG